MLHTLRERSSTILVMALEQKLFSYILFLKHFCYFFISFVTRIAEIYLASYFFRCTQQSKLLCGSPCDKYSRMRRMQPIVERQPVKKVRVKTAISFQKRSSVSSQQLALRLSALSWDSFLSYFRLKITNYSQQM